MTTTTHVCLIAGTGLLVLAVWTPAMGQSVESAGVRARGMGGAFTAIADDSSATWWNPAGVAGGAYANAIIEWDRTDDPVAAGTNGRTTVTGFSTAFPALGFSYYRFRISGMRRSTSTAAQPPSRQDQGPAGLDLATLEASQLGATLGQSVGGHLVVATTLKWLRGGEAGGSSTNAVSLDAGALATFGPARLGIAMRNVTSPSLGPADLFTLDRQARAGAAITVTPARAAVSLNLAVDADLTISRLATGDERRIAGGAEAWLFGRRIGLRGGLSGSTVGERRSSASAGLSLALRSGFYVDGATVRGDDAARRGWSAGLRVTF